MRLAKIKINVFYHKYDKSIWYIKLIEKLNGKIITIDDGIYYKEYKTNEWYKYGVNGLFSYSNQHYKILTNLNKNKKIIINEKYQYINIQDVVLLSKSEERLYKLKQLTNGIC